MTLCQYYDAYAKNLGWNSWNHYCEATPESHRIYMKKRLKQIYKREAGTQTPAEKLADGDVSSNQPEGGSNETDFGYKLCKNEQYARNKKEI